MSASCVTVPVGVDEDRSVLSVVLTEGVGDVDEACPDSDAAVDEVDSNKLSMLLVLLVLLMLL